MHYANKIIIIDEEDIPQSPSSPLLGNERKKTQLVSFLKGHHAGNHSPSHLRRRNLQGSSALPGRQPDPSMFDTASLYSTPSMLSLHFDEGGEEEDAQPTTPHVLTEKIEVCLRECLQCHGNGGHFGAQCL